ncbi:hypothetical protein [Corynebacterium aquatimens]|uniref:Uncharacterized protein n=1 Tax=Corynebacterium aquatimens TaxID=1190508 RepID=A0A931DYU7_9CORY|nr:hypothetical protein [Corynebacterium aquatimens]MBG6122615.1 hypothetical protein [Corynebacterium aquatimens]WJY64845.1 hypothetical protein CAQUA_00485 [Corynebacterium aquatimens]
MQIPSFTIRYCPNDHFYLPIGLIAMDSESGEVAVPIMNGMHPAAPIGYTDEAAAAIAERIGDFLEDSMLNGGPNHDLLGDHIDLVDNPVVEADDFETGLDTLIELHILNPRGFASDIYDTFTLDIRRDRAHDPMCTCYEPIAVFAINLRSGDLHTTWLSDNYPLHDPPLTREERRMVKRERKRLAKHLRGPNPHRAFDKVSRPQFCVHPVGQYDALSGQDAISAACVHLVGTNAFA